MHMPADYIITAVVVRLLMCYRILCAFILRYLLFIPVFSSGAGYDLPVLPDSKAMLEAMKTLDGPYSNLTSRKSSAYYIPRLLWLTMKHVPTNKGDLPLHARQYIKLNNNWEPAIVDNQNADRFMRTVFANTSILWAYESINPVLGAAKADMWRYAVLYAYGGVYIDADATFNFHLDKFIWPRDKFILATEKNHVLTCYQGALFPPVRLPAMFKKNMVLQWLLISAPQHPFMAQTMTNVVAIIKSIYQNRSILLSSVQNEHILLCITGPPIFTRAVSQVISRLPADKVGVRYAGTDFEPIRGKAKARVEPEGPNHYSLLMAGGAPFLTSLEKQ